MSLSELSLDCFDELSYSFSERGERVMRLWCVASTYHGSLGYVYMVCPHIRFSIWEVEPFSRCVKVSSYHQKFRSNSRMHGMLSTDFQSIWPSLF